MDVRDFFLFFSLSLFLLTHTFYNLHRPLKIDKSLARSEDDYSGSLLLRIGVGKPKEWEELDKIKSRWTLEPIRTRPYQLRLHLFRGRNLPVADENGFSDPFAKVMYCGKTEEGPIIRRTLNPNWYTTIFMKIDGPVLGKGMFSLPPHSLSLSLILQ